MNRFDFIKAILSFVLCLCLLSASGCGQNDEDIFATGTSEQAATASVEKNQSEEETKSADTPLDEPPRVRKSELVLKRDKLSDRITLPYDPVSFRCSNYYNDSPDIPVAGQTSFTYLSQALINSAQEGEVMYFLVCVSDLLESSYDSEITNYKYENETVGKIVASYESARREQNERYSKLSSQGMDSRQIEADAEYISLVEKAEALFEKRTYARSAGYYAAIGDKLGVFSEYFRELGFGIIGDINDTAMHRRMTVSGNAARLTIAFGVSGTLDELERLCAENDKYGIVLFASDSEGHWVEHNDDPEERGANLTYLTEIPELWEGQVYYSYKQLGLYDRIVKVN